MQDKTVLITGGNAGLGLETAVALATMGAAVTITARDAARGEAARQEIIERSGADPQQIEVMALDLASTAPSGASPTRSWHATPAWTSSSTTPA